MDRHYRWAALMAAVLMALVVGIVAYNVGVSHGIGINLPAAAAPAGIPGPYYYGWHRPWGVGFFPPFLLIVFVFLAFRLLFWGSFHRRGWYYTGPYDVPHRFEEWHRREHERMNQTPAGQPPREA